MGREVVLLQQLQRGLTGWLDVIRRATGAEEVRVEFTAAEGLSISATWAPSKASSVIRTHKKTFAPAVLFGHSLQLPPPGRHLVKRPCDCARDYIQEILHLRGVLS
jgi:hypothetical protein